MILFTMLLLVIGIIAIITLISLIAGGAAIIVVFGDLIICVAIIVFIIKMFRKK